MLAPIFFRSVYEICAGTLPFRGDTPGVMFKAILDEEPTPAARLNPAVSPSLRLPTQGWESKPKPATCCDNWRIAPSMEYLCPYGISVVHAALGQKDQAFAYLDKAYEMRADCIAFLRVAPRADPHKR